MKICTSALAAAVGLGCVAGAASASSIDLSFSRVEPHNAAVNPASQFHCTISDVAGHSDQVTFSFSNAVGIASSIMEIYFDDRGSNLLNIANLTQQGASFASGSSPGNLPGGQNLGPAFNSDFSVDAGSGGPTEGLNAAADYLTLKFDLPSGKTYSSVVSAIQTGALRVGMHVISIGTGGQSDSFVDGPGVVPLPPAAMTGGVLLAGLAGAAGVRRRAAR
jgi:hypothetical protein